MFHIAGFSQQQSEECFPVFSPFSLLLSFFFSHAERHINLNESRRKEVSFVEIDYTDRNKSQYYLQFNKRHLQTT